MASKAETEARRLVRQRSGGVCERCGAARATDWHHRKNRSQGGGWSAANGLHLCRSCHLMITDTRTAFYNHGWLVKSWDDETTIPVHTVHGFVLLDDEGGFTAYAEVPSDA